MPAPHETPPSTDKFEQTLAALINSGEPQIIQGGRKGLEKESLRVTPDGRIAQTPHPRALGSALTNEHITTDYSEALIELVTPTFRTSWELLQYLLDLHQFVYQHLGDELLWATSMPSILDGDASIPIAQFGKSNIGRMKTVYREGLGDPLRPHHAGHLRRALQLLVPREDVGRLGGHRAVARARRKPSSPTATSTCCATTAATAGSCSICSASSPVVCNSFLRGRNVTLPRLSKDTSYEPYATSLRMSDLGYRNRNQAGLSVSVNSLDEYVRDLSRAITTPHAPYEKLGVEGGRRIAPAQRQHPADRERVLQLHPARSAWRVRASGRPRRCCAPAWNTSRCARST